MCRMKDREHLPAQTRRDDYSVSEHHNTVEDVEAIVLSSELSDHVVCILTRLWKTLHDDLI